MRIYKWNTVINRYIAIDEKCFEYTVGCGVGFPATAQVSRIGDTYGTGYFQILSALSIGDCTVSNSIFTDIFTFYCDSLGA